MTAPALPNSQSAADPSADLLQWEQFSKLIEDGVLLVDFNQVVQFVNPSASKLFGEELRNRALSDLFKGINFDDVFIPSINLAFFISKSFAKACKLRQE